MFEVIQGDAGFVTVAGGAKAGIISKWNVRRQGSKPDGTPRKVLDVTRVNALGWRAEVPLCRGLDETYAWYLDTCARS